MNYVRYAGLWGEVEVNINDNFTLEVNPGDDKDLRNKAEALAEEIRHLLEKAHGAIECS